MDKLEYKINKLTQSECHSDMASLNGLYQFERIIPDYTTAVGYVHTSLMRKYGIDIEQLRKNVQYYRFKVHYKEHMQD